MRCRIRFRTLRTNLLRRSGGKRSWVYTLSLSPPRPSFEAQTLLSSPASPGQELGASFVIEKFIQRAEQSKGVKRFRRRKVRGELGVICSGV